MEKKDYKEFASCMAGLQDIFTPEKPVSKNKIEVYFEIFCNWNWSIAQFKEACLKITQEKKIACFPLPAELKETLYGNSEVRAIQAIKKLEDAVDHYGYYYSMVFDDPIIHAVVDRMGGWEWMTTQTYEEWKWIRKDFTKLYTQLSSLNINMIDAPQRLIGYCERTNDGFERDERLQHMIINLSEQQKLIGQDEQKLLE